MKGILE